MAVEGWCPFHSRPLRAVPLRTLSHEGSEAKETEAGVMLPSLAMSDYDLQG